MDGSKKVPPEFRDDVSHAAKILLEMGAREVYLYGSVADGRSHPGSDIDIATVGLPKDRFFAAYGALLMKLDHSVDLIGLDYANELSESIRKRGGILRVA
ncbi:MAG: nucleotidyltransferase domain-containing protein [Alkalispirochaeta sp.]|jgi:predicted nucleotidyltransferase